MVYCCCDFGSLCLSWFTMGFIVYFDDYGVTWQLQFTVLILVFCGDYDVLWWWLWCPCLLWGTMVIMVSRGDYGDYGDYAELWWLWWLCWLSHHHYLRIASFWAKKVYSIHPGHNEELDLYGGQECDIKSHLDNISLCVHLSPVTGRYITAWYLVTHRYWLTNQVHLSQIVSYRD